MYSLAQSTWTRWSRSPRAASVLRPLVLRAILLVLMLLVAAPSLAVRGEAYRCRHSGRVMTACCCKAKAAPQARHAARAPEVKAASCCDTVKAASTNAVPALRDVAAQIPPHSALAYTVLRIPRGMRSTSFGRVDTAFDLARAGPAIFLRDCRLLS